MTTCVCGAELDSVECKTRAHLRGPRAVSWSGLFGADPNYTEGKPVDLWLDEQRRGIRDEKEAFEQVLVYHYRRDAESCAICGPLPLGSSFPAHLWDVFVRLRNA